MRRGLLAALVLTGCGHLGGMSATRYPGKLDLTLVCADSYSVDKACRNAHGVTVTDQGQAVSRVVHLAPDSNTGLARTVTNENRACWRSRARELWLRMGEFCDIIRHEFCHIDGRLSRKECDDLF